MLFDFRQELPEQSNTPAMPAALLSAVFPNYSQKTGACKPGANGGPKLLGTAEGAFTDVGAKQTAYLIEPGDCENDPNAFGEERLAIFTGDKLEKVARVSGTQLLGTYDLDLDGKRELLLAKGNTREGLYSMNAHLLGIQEKTYHVAEDFGRVRFENCGATDGTITAVKVDYLPEVDPKTRVAVQKMPRFAAEIYRTPCPKNGEPLKWVRVQGTGGQ